MTLQSGQLGAQLCRPLPGKFQASGCGCFVGNARAGCQAVCDFARCFWRNSQRFAGLEIAALLAVQAHGQHDRAAHRVD